AQQVLPVLLPEPIFQLLIYGIGMMAEQVQGLTLRTHTPLTTGTMCHWLSVTVVIVLTVLIPGSTSQISAVRLPLLFLILIFREALLTLQVLLPVPYLGRLLCGTMAME